MNSDPRTRRLAATVAGALLVTAFTTGPLSPATAATSPAAATRPATNVIAGSDAYRPWSQDLRLLSAVNLGVLTVQPSSHQAVIAPNVEAPGQHWDTADAIAPLIGAKTITSYAPATKGWCLQPAGADPTLDGAFIEVRPCVDFSHAQGWALVRGITDRHRYVIVNHHSNKVLTVMNVSGQHAQLVQRPYRPGMTEQQFLIDNCVQCG